MNTGDQLPGSARSAFPSTRWSMIVNAGAGSESSMRSALEELCQRYWYPLYSFVRRQGRSHHEAEDCTQEFLARLLAASAMNRVRREQGRFRTYLLTALRNFLTDEWHRAGAAKRGGGLTPLSLEFERAERNFSCEPCDPGLSPEQAFDRTWALGMIEHAVQELRGEYEKTDRGELFEQLQPLLWTNSNHEALATSATRAGITLEAFHVALHRARRRVGQRLRAAVAETVASDDEIEVELRHLISALGS